MPVKYSPEIKAETLRLRTEEGLKYNEISKKMNVPLVTLKRWLKGIKKVKGTKDTKNTELTGVTQKLKVPDVPEISDDPEISAVSDTLSDTKEITPPFDNLKISFNTNDGGISLTSSDTPMPHDHITSKAIEPKESAGVQPEISAEDSYFGKLLPEGSKIPGNEEKSGVLGYAIPIGLLLAGAYLMKTQPDVDTNTNAYRGGEIRKHGLSWLEQGEDKW